MHANGLFIMHADHEPKSANTDMSANATDDSGWCSDVGLDASISVGEHASVGEGEPRRKNSLKIAERLLLFRLF
jgi:hypothetical protein